MANDENMCVSCADGYTARITIPIDEYLNIVACDKNKELPMSGGTVAGIIIGVFVALLIVSGLVFFFINKNKNNK